MNEIRCGEFIAGCPHVSRGETVDELMESVREHAREDHGLSEIDKDLREALLESTKER